MFSVSSDSSHDVMVLSVTMRKQYTHFVDKGLNLNTRREYSRSSGENFVEITVVQVLQDAPPGVILFHGAVDAELQR